MRNRSVERAPLSTTEAVEGFGKRWTARDEANGSGGSERGRRKVRIATTLYDVEGGECAKNGESVFEVKKMFRDGEGVVRKEIKRR